MCTKTNTTLLAWVFWLTYHRFIIIIKQTYSYLKTQLMTSIKWGAINSEVNSEYIYWFISIIRIQQLIMLIITRIIINIYIIKKHDPIHINNQIFIIFLMHMENYPLTWLESKQKSKADTEENPTDVPPVEYQNYLNIKETYSRMTQKNI
jgi:hypothetical protein